MKADLLKPAVALLLGLSCGAASAAAVNVSTLSASGKRVIARVELPAPGELRATPLYSNGPALVLRAGSVTAEGRDGTRVLSGIAEADQSGVTRPNTGDEEIANLVSLRKTGRKEMRAGFEGEMYDVTFFDRAGRRRVETVVVSSDPRAVALSAAWTSLNQALGANLPESADLQGQLQANGLGLLRFGYRYQVDSYSETLPQPPPAPVVAAVAAPLVEAAPEPVLEAPPAPVEEAPVPAEPPKKRKQGNLFGLLFGG